MNALFNTRGSWIGDGSPNQSIEVTGTNPEIVTFSSAAGSGSPFSICRTAENFDDRQWCYTANVLSLESKDSLSIGIVSKEKLKPGYKVNGMFYNGNLTNGSGALSVGFGDYVKQGSTVGVHCERTSNATIVTLIVDGKNLGRSFEIANDTTTTYYPCLHVSGTAKVEVSFPENMPEPGPDSPSADGYEGKWELKCLRLGADLIEKDLPDNLEVVAAIEAHDPQTYKCSFKVGNRLSTRIKVTGELNGFHTVNVRAGMMTRMLSPPPIQDIEDTLRNNVENISKMQRSDSGLLLAGSQIEVHFVQHEPRRDPVRSYD